MIDRSRLLATLVDDEVIGILKKRLGPERVADLVMEVINPHRPLTTEEMAKLAGVSPRAMRDRLHQAPPRYQTRDGRA